MMLLIIKIITIVPCMHEIPQNTIISTLHCVVYYIYAIQCLDVDMQYAKIPTLVTNYSTKGNIFTVNQCISQQLTPITILKKSLSQL